jgi:hypothetical protein
VEFNKKLTMALIIFGACGIIVSYVLAFLDKSVNDTVTVAMITQIMVTSISYLLYQYKLKDSRNRNGVDEEGVPFELGEITADIFTKEDSSEVFNDLFSKNGTPDDTHLN